MMCNTARGLKECMANLMWFTQEDVLDAPPLEPDDDQPQVSPTPEEETALLSEPQAAATHPPRSEEQATKSQKVAKLGEAVTEIQGRLVCLPSPGFKS